MPSRDQKARLTKSTSFESSSFELEINAKGLTMSLKLAVFEKANVRLTVFTKIDWFESTLFGLESKAIGLPLSRNRPVSKVFLLTKK